MAALDRNIIRSVLAGKPQRLVPLPVLGGALIYNGALVCVDAGGLAVPGSDAAGLTFMGLAYRGLDNSLGSDGDAVLRHRLIEVDMTPIASYDVLGSQPMAGQRAFLIDDNTITVDPTTHSIDVGLVTDPDDLHPGRWFVDHLFAAR